MTSTSATPKTMPQLKAESELMLPWLKRMVKGQGFDGVVLGMSGGFDSSFCAFLASQREALGQDGVVGILMPCQSSGDSVNYALNVCSELGIRHFIVSLTAFFNPMVSFLNEVRRQQHLPELSPLECGNIKARLRMTVLYSFNWVLNCLVMNTCNLSETLTGNETKWGDAAGDIGLFNNYTKTELRQMAITWGFDLKFRRVFDAIPTPDLEEGNPDHTDEAIMGLSYQVVDAFIRGYESVNGFPIPLTPQGAKRFKEMRDRSAHKREPMPCFNPEAEKALYGF